MAQGINPPRPAGEAVDFDFDEPFLPAALYLAMKYQCRTGPGLSESRSQPQASLFSASCSFDPNGDGGVSRFAGPGGVCVAGSTGGGGFKNRSFFNAERSNAEL